TGRRGTARGCLGEECRACLWCRPPGELDCSNSQKKIARPPGSEPHRVPGPGPELKLPALAHAEDRPRGVVAAALLADGSVAEHREARLQQQAQHPASSQSEQNPEIEAGAKHAAGPAGNLRAPLEAAQRRRNVLALVEALAGHRRKASKRELSRLAADYPGLLTEKADAGAVEREPVGAQGRAAVDRGLGSQREPTPWTAEAFCVEIEPV